MPEICSLTLRFQTAKWLSNENEDLVLKENLQKLMTLGKRANSFSVTRKKEKKANSDSFASVERYSTVENMTYVEHVVFKLELEAKRIDSCDREGKKVVSSSSIFKDGRNSYDACQ